MELALTPCSSFGISSFSSQSLNLFLYRRAPTTPLCTTYNFKQRISHNSSFSNGSKFNYHFYPNRDTPNGCSPIMASSQVDGAGSDPLLNKVSLFKDAFWRFLRPHTIRGTTLGSLSLVTKALIENPSLIRWSLVLKALSGLLALICGNGYIVGINQIYDIGIDKVNKPYLPIAAGDLSVQSAWFLVLMFAVAGLLIVGVNFGPFITSLYCLGLLLGTIYSVPPFRLKRFPVLAFLIIATVRGFLLNFGVYYSTRSALGLQFEWSSPVAFITTFVTIFALVIAITKDLSDVEGDRKFQISTLATKLGVQKIAFLGSGLLLINYIGAILAAVYMPQAFNRYLMISVHSILACSLISQSVMHSHKKMQQYSQFLFLSFVTSLYPIVTMEYFLVAVTDLVVGKRKIYQGRYLSFLSVYMESILCGVYDIPFYLAPLSESYTSIFTLKNSA